VDESSLIQIPGRLFSCADDELREELIISQPYKNLMNGLFDEFYRENVSVNASELRHKGFDEYVEESRTDYITYFTE
jgi:hypothetical protein